MKSKAAILFTLATVVILGVSVWVLTRGSEPASNNVDTDRSQTAEPGAPTIELNFPDSSLELTKGEKVLAVSADVGGDQAVVRVVYLIDGKVVARSTEPPFKVKIDITDLNEGEYTLQAFAYDAAGNIGRSEIITFTIIDANDSEKPAEDQPQAGAGPQGVNFSFVGLSLVSSQPSSGSDGTPSSPTGGGGDSGGGGSDGESPGGEDPDDDGSGGEDPGDGDGGETDPWPLVAPAQICGNNSILGGGPISAPAGAVTVPAGDNSSVDLEQSNTTYWFDSGVHTLGTGQFSQIIPGTGSTYIGAPGAIIDGQGLNNFAFTQHATDVTIRYLTIRNFEAPRDQGVVNHDGGRGWTIEYNTITDNGGAGLMAGPDNTYRYNCIKDNGQYGINSCCEVDAANEIDNFVLDHNEITGNNTDDWESQVEGCGCTGGVKFWINKDVTVTNNYVHDNRGTGLWLDNNNQGFIIEGNYIADNDGQAIFIEAGYDARVRYNNIKGNGLVEGKGFADRGDPFPYGSIYISDNGSPEGYGLKTAPMVISHNKFDNNWGGVALWENADRYCSSTAHTHPPACTIKVDLRDDAQCENATENDIPDTMNKFDCRWSTENVIVEENEFIIDKATVGAGCEGGDYCGVSGVFSNYGSYAEFEGYEIPWRITFEQNNTFRNNTYVGDWTFAGFQTTQPDGSRVTWENWTAPAPEKPDTFTHNNRPETFGQDQGSTKQ